MLSSIRLDVHRSAVVAALAYGVGLVGLAAEPEPLVAALHSSELRLALLLAGLAAFFTVVLIAQHQMGVPLTSRRYDPPTGLTTSGLFSVSRHPIYVAFLAPLAAMVPVAPVPGLVALAFYILVMDRFVMAPEENALGAKFGRDYDAYAAATPRWFGI